MSWICILGIIWTFHHKWNISVKNNHCHYELRNREQHIPFCAATKVMSNWMRRSRNCVFLETQRKMKQRQMSLLPRVSVRISIIDRQTCGREQQRQVYSTLGSTGNRDQASNTMWQSRKQCELCEPFLDVNTKLFFPRDLYTFYKLSVVIHQIVMEI